MKDYVENKAGTAALYDSFTGLIPCVVVAVHKPGDGRRCGDYDAVTIRITKTVGAYYEGEEMKTATHKVVPKSHIVTRMGSTSIATNYAWIV